MVDNHGTHKHPRVKAWIQLHFIPTSSSWLSLVKRWFREITDKRIRCGSFHHVPNLIEAIMAYLDNHNQNPQVFVWSAPVEPILTEIAKCKEVLDSLHYKQFLPTDVRARYGDQIDNFLEFLR